MLNKVKKEVIVIHGENRTIIHNNIKDLQKTKYQINWHIMSFNMAILTCMLHQKKATQMQLDIVYSRVEQILMQRINKVGHHCIQHHGMDTQKY